MSDDLVERLELKTPAFMNGAIKCGGKLINPDGPEAAAEIRSLREQLWEVRCVCRTWNHPLADKIMALIEAQPGGPT
jgi:hypothetical protein